MVAHWSDATINESFAPNEMALASTRSAIIRTRVAKKRSASWASGIARMSVGRWAIPERFETSLAVQMSTFRKAMPAAVKARAYCERNEIRCGRQSERYCRAARCAGMLV